MSTRRSAAARPIITSLMGRSPSLSLAITTRGPAERVRALLELMRPHVDEVVLGADRDGDPAVLDACADLADRRLRFELRDSPARLVGWIQNHCSGDWILRMDDDELPGAELLAALPELIADPFPIQYSLRRHWSWPDAARRIDESPWSLDYQTRLLRNLPGVWTFPGTVHTVGETVGETRYVDLPVYHVDLLATDLAARRRKAAAYEAETPGLEFDGASINGPYLPELVPQLRTVRVPAADATAIARLLSAGPVPQRLREGAPVEEAGFADVDRFNLTHVAAVFDYAGTAELEAPLGRWPGGALRHQVVCVRNTGSAPWPRVPVWHEPVRLAYRWIHPADGVAHRGYADFPETVEPGRASRMLIGIRAPAAPGPWRLELGLERGGAPMGEWGAHDVEVSEHFVMQVPLRQEPSLDVEGMQRRVDAERGRAVVVRSAAAYLKGMRRYRVAARLAALGSGLDDLGANGRFNGQGRGEDRGTPRRGLAARPAAARPRVGLAITTRGPAARVRALLELVRPHVDEVVLAVDEAGDPETLAACADLADRRLRFPSPGMGSLLIPWILHTVSAEWILRLDDDEVPAPALLDALPELVAERRPVRYGFARRWLHPTPDRWIADPPWGVEHQYRLVRNLPGLWRLPGKVHAFEEIAGDTRYLDLPLYHLDTVLLTARERRAKALRYEMLRGGIRYSGMSVNALYLPEAFPELATAPVPLSDRRGIEQLLHPPPAAASGRPRAVVEAVPAREVAAHNPTRRLSPRAYRGRVVLRDVPEVVAPDTMRAVTAIVRNDGDEEWPWGAEVEPLIRIGYRWRRVGDGAIAVDARCTFSETVRPGAESLVLMGVRTPDPGDYELEVGLIHELVRPFGEEDRVAVRVDALGGVDDLVATLPPGFLDEELGRAAGDLAVAAVEARGEREAEERRLASLRGSGAYRLAEIIGGSADLARRARRGRA